MEYRQVKIKKDNKGYYFKEIQERAVNLVTVKKWIDCYILEAKNIGAMEV